MDIAAHFLSEARRILRRQKDLGDRAMAQLEEADLLRSLDRDSNSVAIIVKHIAGNMRSRWTDFLSTDGEKPDRRRDQEFVLDLGTTREQVLQWWEAGWSCLFQALDALQPEDLGRTVFIRSEEHSVMQAIQRQIDHYGHHVGQIVLLAKHWKGPQWKTLSIPRGESEAVNARMRGGSGR